MQMQLQQIEPLDTSSAAPDYDLRLCMTHDGLSANLDHLELWLEKVEKATKGRLTPEKVMERYVSGEWQAWFVMKDEKSFGHYATHFWTDDSGRMVCSVPFMVGEKYAEWAFLIDQGEQWAKAQGATRMLVSAPRAHAKRSLHDYKASHWVFEKIL